jgi:TusA-related sulfurtransferase
MRKHEIVETLCPGIAFAQGTGVGCYPVGYLRRLFAMRSDEKLDIRSVPAPYCLLMVKATLASMQPGTVLEVQVSDPESISDLMTVLVRSGDQIVTREAGANFTCLWVQKGPGAGPACLKNP